MKLVGVARASLEELLLDYHDFLRQRNMALWNKDDPRALAVRRRAYRSNRSYRSYEDLFERGSPETAANAMICLVHQANYLLDQLLARLEKDFLREGGFTERLHAARTRARARETGERGL